MKNRYVREAAEGLFAQDPYLARRAAETAGAGAKAAAATTRKRKRKAAGASTTAADTRPTTRPTTGPSTRPTTRPAPRVVASTAEDASLQPRRRKGPPAIKEPALRPLALLLEIVGDEQRSDREKTIALVEIGRHGKAARGAVAVLVRILAEPGPPEIRAAAARALGHIGPTAADDAVPALIKAAGDENAQVHQAAMVAVGKMGPAAESAVPRLAEIVRGEDPRASEYALSALVGIGEPAVAVVIELLKDHTPGRTWAAVQALSRMGPKAAAAVPELMALLKRDTGTNVPEIVIEALGNIGAPAKAAVPDLAKIAADAQSPFRRQAIDALGQIGPAAASAETVTALRQALGDWQVTDAAATALGRLGPAAKPAAAELVAVLRAEHEKGLKGAARGSIVVYHLGSPGTAALQALGQIGPAAAGPEALPLAEEVLKNAKDVDLLREARLAVQRLRQRPRLLVRPRGRDRP